MSAWWQAQSMAHQLAFLLTVANAFLGTLVAQRRGASMRTAIALGVLHPLALLVALLYTAWAEHKAYGAQR
jgi:hypothetical protein